MSAFSKHIINEPKDVVHDSLVGLTYTNPDVSLVESSNVVILNDIDSERVHVICGGGSGHEPSHAAYVGDGMLSAAVAGTVFASPNSRQVEDALERLQPNKGVLVIVKNYTGDAINFGLARERWNATHPGKETIKMIAVGDDVAVPRSSIVLTGRRGLAATNLVQKVAGALAKKGASLEEVHHLAKLVADRSGSIGMGLEHCHVPGTETAEAYLKADEAEIGMGIHNEPGNRKISPVPKAKDTIEQLMSMLTDTSDKERAYLDFKMDGKDSVVLLVNNLGGLSELELGIVAKESTEWLMAKGVSVERTIMGTFMTSLNLPGFSLTVLLLPRESAKPEAFASKLDFGTDLILECIDAPVKAPGWKFAASSKPGRNIIAGSSKPPAGSDTKGPKAEDKKLFLSALKAAMETVVAAEPDITRYDTIAGDGDAGLTLRAGAEGILAELDAGKITGDDVVADVVTIANVVEAKMGGTSGGLYGIALNGLAKGLSSAAEELKTDVADSKVWARGLELGLNVLYQYTRARPPSRTLVDPLATFILTFSTENFAKSYDAAKEAAEATKVLEAKAGRAAYVDKSKIADAGVPDAGAWGVLMMLDGIKSVL